MEIDTVISGIYGADNVLEAANSERSLAAQNAAIAQLAQACDDVASIAGATIGAEAGPVGALAFALAASQAAQQPCASIAGSVVGAIEDAKGWLTSDMTNDGDLSYGISALDWNFSMGSISGADSASAESSASDAIASYLNQDVHSNPYVSTGGGLGTDHSCGFSSAGSVQLVHL